MEEVDRNSISCLSNGKMEDEDKTSKHDDEGAEKSRSFRENWKDPVFKEKFTYSMFMAGAFITLGMFVGQNGSTFLDIQIITNTNIETAATFLTGGNAGYLAGCIVTGLIYNKVNKVLLMFAMTFGLGAVNIFVPYCTKYELMMMVRIAASLFAGGVDTGINSEHMRIWGSDSNGLLQFQHFCFSIGGFFTPLIAEPFLAKKIDFVEVNSTKGNESEYSNATDHNHLRQTETQVEYLFLIVGLCSVIISLPFLAIFFKERGRVEPEQKVEKRKFSRKGVPLPLLFVMLFGICLFYFVYCCVEDSFFSFLMTFLVEEYDSISKTEGALVTAVAWAAFSLSRFLMIFITKILSTVPLLFLMTISMAVAYTSLTIFAHYRVVSAMIVFSAISALSCSGVFPAGFSWMETEMFQVTGIISSCILVASSLGSIINPLILGYLMEEVSNMWFCYLLVMDTFVLCFLLILLLIFSRCFIDKKYGTLASSLQTNTTITITVTDPLEKQNSDNDEYVDGVRESFIK